MIGNILFIEYIFYKKNIYDKNKIEYIRYFLYLKIKIKYIFIYYII